MDSTGISLTKDLLFKTYIGQQINDVIEPLAKLRMVVFRDFPYLYEGSLTYEQEYLSTYANAEKSFLHAVFYNQRMIGATTAIPLIDESAEVKLPFKQAGFDMNSLFYFGESILLKEFRGLGVGHRFFDERENYARSSGQYTHSCFCSVDRGSGHAAEPADYRPNDIFWTKRGYRKESSLKSYFEWPDIGATEQTFKPMIYWIKEL